MLNLRERFSLYFYVNCLELDGHVHACFHFKNIWFTFIL